MSCLASLGSSNSGAGAILSAAGGLGAAAVGTGPSPSTAMAAASTAPIARPRGPLPARASSRCAPAAASSASARLVSTNTRPGVLTPCQPGASSQSSRYGDHGPQGLNPSAKTRVTAAAMPSERRARTE